MPLVLDDENIVIHDEYTEDPKNNDPNSDAKANNDGNNDMGTSDVSGQISACYTSVCFNQVPGAPVEIDACRAGGGLHCWLSTSVLLPWSSAVL